MSTVRLNLVSLAQEKGVVFGSLQIVDSTHSVANVNVEKDQRRQSKGQSPRDSSASWGVKRSHKVKDENKEVGVALKESET